MIALHHAGVRRGSRWLFRDLSVSVEAGHCVAVLGPNGRGKTTLIKALAGLLAMQEGLRVAPSVIGYVPQAASHALPYRAIDVVVMARVRQLGLFGVPGRADYRAALEALETVDAAGLAQRFFDRLSGGEQQLVLLARAVATGSPALVLDEPASALDLANQNRLLIALQRLRDGQRHAILFSSHLPQHALHVADEALLMMGDTEHVTGPVHSVVTETNLTRLYGVPVRRLAIPDSSGRAVEAAVPMFETIVAS